MHRRSGIPLAVAFVSVVTAACGDTPTGVSTEPSAEPLLTETLASEGAEISRFSTVGFILTFDTDRQLLSAHMPSNICTPDGQLNILEVQRVATSSQIDQFAVLVQGEDVRVAVYHADSPADAGLAGPINSFGFSSIVDVNQFCAFIGGPDLIAEGNVNRVSTASAASFHAQWTGIIQGVNGQDYHLTEVYQLGADAHDPFNPATFTEPVVSILLQPVG